MMMIQVVSLIAALNSAQVIVERGAIASGGLRSWEIQDTFIDKQLPGNDFGRDPLLSAGPGKLVLLKFPGLERYVAPGYRIKSATLILRHALGSPPDIKRVGWVNDPWLEGWGRRGVPANNPSILGSKSKILTCWNVRANPTEGTIGWNGPTAEWPLGSQISDTKTMIQGQDIIFDIPEIEANNYLMTSGYGASLAFDCISQTDFFSSDASQFRPKLVLETEPLFTTMMTKQDLTIVKVKEISEDTAKLTKWLIEVKNQGLAASQPTRIELSSYDGNRSLANLKALAPGESISIESSIETIGSSDPRLNSIELNVLPNGTEDNLKNNLIVIAPGSISVNYSASDAETRYSSVVKKWGYSSFSDFAQAVLNYTNQVVLKSSRFSFAPDGIAAQLLLSPSSSGSKLNLELTDKTLEQDAWQLTVRAFLTSSGLKILEPPSGAIDSWQGIMLGGDTRDDLDIPTILGLSADPMFDPLQVLQPMSASDLLSATDAFLLQSGKANSASNGSDVFPKTTILRLLSSSNKLLSHAEVRLFEGNSQTPFSAMADSGSGVLTLPDRGGTIFPNFTSFENASIRFEATKFGETAVTFLRGWQLIDAVARGSQEVALIPIPFRLPDVQVVRTTNIALEKSFQDEMNPNVAYQLVTDGDKTTGTVVAASNKKRTLILDLGKDRNVGEVELTVFSNVIWKEFQIRVQETGLSADRARLWSAEVDGSNALVRFGKESAGQTTIRYWGTPTVSRYITFEIPPTLQNVKICEVKVHSYQ